MGFLTYDVAVHPAAKYEFDVLFRELMHQVSLGNVLYKREGEFVLFHYTRDTEISKNWNTFSLLARSIILCPTEKRVLAYTIPKFFNYGEVTYELPNCSFEVQEKMDGCLGTIFYWKRKWLVSTRKSFESDVGLWAQKYLDENINKKVLVPGVTYNVEIISKAHRIVINYEKERLCLFCGYDASGNELGREYLNCVANEAGFDRPQIYNFDKFEDIVDIASTLPKDREGFVVRFDCGYRVKVKGDSYCRLHRIMQNITPLTIWDLMRQGKNLDQIREDLQLPEEFQYDFDCICEILSQNYQEILNDLEAFHFKTQQLSDKQLGLLLKSENNIPTHVRSYIFAYRKGNLLERLDQPGRLRDRLFKLFRPRNNVLGGYEPSSIMTRFLPMNEGEDHG